MSKNDLQNSNNILTVIRDSGANVKILKFLERKGCIKIFDVMLENGRENKKVKDKILPAGVWDHCLWDEAVWSDDDCLYDEICKIIGSNNVKDAMHLETHIRNSFDYFVTEDNDFLNKRDILKDKFNVLIVTPLELQKICEK